MLKRKVLQSRNIQFKTSHRYCFDDSFPREKSLLKGQAQLALQAGTLRWQAKVRFVTKLQIHQSEEVQLQLSKSPIHNFFYCTVYNIT